MVPGVDETLRVNGAAVLSRAPEDIARYTAEFYKLAQSVHVARKSNEAGGSSAAHSFEQLVELGKTNKQLDANDQGVVQVVDWLWQYAFDQRASDIHLEPRRDTGNVRFRIDGVLHEVVLCHGRPHRRRRGHEVKIAYQHVV